MAGLGSDSEVVGRDGQWTARISDRWQIWGVNGGYLAAMALRAAGLHTGPMRPTSLECHFLTAAQPGEVGLTTETLRASRRAHSVRVSMAQDGRRILEALVWNAADKLDGLPPRALAAPEGPRPELLRSIEELLPPERRRKGGFWDLFEERPVRPADYVDWPRRPWAEPLLRTWVRFRPESRFPDPFVDAGRTLVAIDVFPFVAAARVLRAEQITHMAPTIALSVSFHDLRPDSEWLLLHADSPSSRDGLVGGRVTVWAEDGGLVATGRTQMLCLPSSPWT